MTAEPTAVAIPNRATRRSLGFRGRLYQHTTGMIPRYVRRHIGAVKDLGAARPTRRQRKMAARIVRKMS